MANLNVVTSSAEVTRDDGSTIESALSNLESYEKMNLSVSLQSKQFNIEVTKKGNIVQFYFMATFASMTSVGQFTVCSSLPYKCSNAMGPGVMRVSNNVIGEFKMIILDDVLYFLTNITTPDPVTLHGCVTCIIET